MFAGLARHKWACSRRSDSGERCEVKRSAKKYKLGSLPSPLYFSSLSLLRTALHYLNAWNRLIINRTHQLRLKLTINSPWETILGFIIQFNVHEES